MTTSPPPEQGEKINRQLDAALKAAHHSNPAMKTATPLKRMMSYMGPINKSEFYGLCKGTFQSPSMSSPMSKILTETLLKYIGRLRMDEVFNEYRQALKGHFDHQLCVLWGNAQSTRVSRPGFLRAHRQELQLFIDMELSCKVEKMIEDGHELSPADIQKVVKAALVGAELYAPESLKLEANLFISDTLRRLYEVEVGNFNLDELDDFKKIMYHSAESLDQEIWKTFDNKVQDLEFGSVEAYINVPHDEWQFRLDSRVKTLAISNCDIPRTIYEKHLYGESAPIPGVPTTVKIPPQLLFDLANGREHINKMLGDSWQSAESIQKQ